APASRGPGPQPGLLSGRARRSRENTRVRGQEAGRNLRGLPVLYRRKHIPGASFAGSGNQAEGIEALQKAVSGMAKDADIVLYCGCCPMERCPNVRPAYQALQDEGFTHVRVLRIPTNMATDWYSKGYPSEAGPAGGGGRQ